MHRSLSHWSPAGLVLSLMASVALAPVAFAEDGPVDDPARLADEAVASNPGIVSMRDRTRELTELADVSNTWPDPHFSVEYSNAPVDSFSIGDTPMGGVEFKLQQRLPEWGWTRTAREVADHGVAKSDHAREEAEVQLRRSVETLYWKLALSRLLESVTHAHIARAEELIRAVRARYEVGAAGQNALLRLEVLHERLKDDLGDFARAQRDLSAGLARSLARPAESRFVTPGEVEAIAPEGDYAAWIEYAKQSRPELAAIREEVKQQQKSASLSRIGIRPEVDVWFKYRLRTIQMPTDPGTDFISLGFSVPIPLGSGKRAIHGEAADFAARDSARARLAAALDEIEAELIAVEAGWRRAAQKAATYRDTLIPAAQSALATTLNDFSVGKAEFSTLYEAEVDLLVLERTYLSATIETHLQRAAARALTGRRDLGGSS